MVMKEGFDVAGRHPDNQDSLKQFALRQAAKMLSDAGVIDPNSRVETSPIATAASPIEAKAIPQEYRPFTDLETKALVNDGAHIFNLTGETIEGEQGSGRLFRYLFDGGDRLLKLPSINTQVAIYTDPKKFFIPNSGNKDLLTQEELAKKDGQELRKRLGLKDKSVDVIIPDSASTFTELTFKYLDETTKQGKGVWLFGSKYAKAQGLSWVYGRTKNPVNESGSFVAGVGNAGPGGGLVVGNWRRGRGSDGIRVVRLVVAKKK